MVKRTKLGAFMDAKELRDLVEETRKVAESPAKQEALKKSLEQAMKRANETNDKLDEVGRIRASSLAKVFTV